MGKAVVTDATLKAKDHIRQRLLAARRMAGLTQQEVGGSFGTTHAYISDLERGRVRVPSCLLVALAKYYGKPVAWFVPDGFDDVAKYFDRGVT